MKCPACGNELSRAVSGEITVDVCRGGCGGVWFDRFELKAMDEPGEAVAEGILDVSTRPGVSIDRGPRRRCPKCANVSMMRHFYSVKKQVQVDECPSCAGFWLDLGELVSIRSQFKSEAERDKATEQYFSEVFGVQLQAMKAESDEKLEKARKIAWMFRFICPSYYVPGKQEWGAF